MSDKAAKPTFFGRYRTYAHSCVGHSVQGLVAAGLAVSGPTGGIIAFIWAFLFIYYQRMSFDRKVNWDGRGDTAGLDVADFLLGFVLGIGIYSAYIMLRYLGVF